MEKPNIFLNTSGPVAAQVTNMLERWGGAPTCGSISDDAWITKKHIYIYIFPLKQKHSGIPTMFPPTKGET